MSTSTRILRTVLLTGAVALAMAVSGCAGAPADQAPGADDAGEASDATDTSDAAPAPSALVGLWRVDAAGETDDVWVQIGSPFSAQEVTVWRDCGTLSGSWMAGAGALIASLESSTGSCDATEGVSWLEGATGYAATDGGMALLDADGAETATLTVDGEPPANPDVADEYRQQPELADDELAALDETPARPEGFVPAAAEDLVGRWVPTTEYESDPFLELADDGTWTGSDGCNGQNGRWALTADGGVLATAGPQTMIGCDGESLGSMLAESSWAAVDGDILTLHAADGSVVVEAVRG